MKNRRRLILVAALALAGIGHAMTAGGLPAIVRAQQITSQQVAVYGDVSHPGTFALPDLQNLPAITQTISFLAGGGSESHTFTGANLWALLNSIGLPVNASVRNDILNRYLLATGSDGYKAVVAMGEIHPNFGNQDNLMAYAETINGISQGLGSSGFSRITVPGDARGGRYVSNLVSLQVQTPPSTVVGTGGGVSTQFSVSGMVKKSATFAMSDLQAMPQVTRTLTVTSGGIAQTRTFAGVDLWSLLNSELLGLVTNAAVKNDALRMYVVATGSDGVKTVISIGEMNPLFGNRAHMVAISETINGVAQPLGSNGFARLVVSGDRQAGRFISNLIGLEVFNASAP